MFSSQHSIPQPVLGFQHFHFLLVIQMCCEKDVKNVTITLDQWNVRSFLVAFIVCCAWLPQTVIVNYSYHLIIISCIMLFWLFQTCIEPREKKSTNVTLPQVAAFLVLTFMVETNCVQKLPDINVSRSCSARSLIN